MPLELPREITAKIIIMKVGSDVWGSILKSENRADGFHPQKLESGEIEIAPLAFMRGRTLKK